MPSTPQDFQKKSKKSKNLTTSTAGSWKKNAGAKPRDVELPSGNVAKLKQIPMPTLLADGLFPDSLSGFVRDAISSEKPESEAKADANVQMAKMMNDPADMAAMFDVFDKITLLAVIEPSVLPKPEDEDDRDDNLLYVDEVDLEDKMFIFNFCVGGSKDLQRFRTESADAMGSLAAVEGVQNPS